MNSAPFHIGQRVVAIIDGKSHSHPSHKISKGDIFTVLSLKRCECGRWSIDIGKKHNFPGSRCYGCKVINFDKVLWCDSNLFAPITTRSVEIDETIKEQAEEMIGVKETIKELNPSLC